MGHDAPAIDPVIYDSQDFGIGQIGPEGGTVRTGNHWAAVSAGAGATAETVLITIALAEEPYCDLPSGTDLKQSLGCWDINRYPAGGFAEDIVAEACVAAATHPNPHRCTAEHDEVSPVGSTADRCGLRRPTGRSAQTNGPCPRVP